MASRHCLFSSLLLALVASSPAQAARIDVYLIAGQSNATGQGYLRNLPADFVLPAGVELFHSGPPHLKPGTPALTWTPLAPASESPDRFGVELSLARSLRLQSPSTRIAIIKHARSGTHLHTQWHPGTSASDRSDWGPHFTTFVETAEAGLNALRVRGDTPVLRGLYWHQGEADAEGDPAHATAYRARLTRFFVRVREQLQAPDLPIVFALITPAPSRGPGREIVRAAQRGLDQHSGQPFAVPGATLLDTDDLPRRADDPATPYPNDREHLGTVGILLAGERAARIFAETGFTPRGSASRDAAKSTPPTPTSP